MVIRFGSSKKIDGAAVSQKLLASLLEQCSYSSPLGQPDAYSARVEKSAQRPSFAVIASLADIRGELSFGMEMGPVINAGAFRLLIILRLRGDLFRVVSNLPVALDHLPAGSRVREVIWRSDFSINHRQVETYRAGRLFLAGDAAHIHSPLGGRSMNLSIEDAVEFARILDQGHLDDCHRSRNRKSTCIVSLVRTLTYLMASPKCGPNLIRKLLLPMLLRRPPSQG